MLLLAVSLTAKLERGYAGRQILINLLSNAVKLTPEGGKVRVSSFLKNGGLAIEVSDTGIGIAAEDIPKVMASFGQIESKIVPGNTGFIEPRFEIVERLLVFRHGLGGRLLARFANRHPELYERRLAWIFPAWFLIFKLRAVKAAP